MTYKEESYVLDSIKQIRAETHENNIMLKAIVKYLANEAAYANQENENDFVRNVMANMFSNVIEFGNTNRRR